MHVQILRISIGLLLKRKFSIIKKRFIELNLVDRGIKFAHHCIPDDSLADSLFAVNNVVRFIYVKVDVIFCLNSMIADDDFGS